MLATIEALPSSPRMLVMSYARPDDIRIVRDASPTAWLDIDVLIRVDEAIASAKDPVLVETLFHQLAMTDFASGYLKPFIAAAIDLFGPSPGSFLKWVPRGWGTVFQNSGSLAAEDVTSKQARLVHAELCGELMESDVWLTGHRAYFTGIFTIAKTKGEVVVEEREVAKRRLVLLFRW
jgi:hypothetical protein